MASFLTKCTAWRYKNTLGRKLFRLLEAPLCPDHQYIPNTSSQLLDWLKEKKVKHELFALTKTGTKIYETKGKVAKDKGKNEAISDKEAFDLLKNEMKNSEFENGDIQEIPEGKNMFMFFLMQGKSGTDPIQVFSDWIKFLICC